MLLLCLSCLLKASVWGLPWLLLKDELFQRLSILKESSPSLSLVLALLVNTSHLWQSLINLRQEFLIYCKQLSLASLREVFFRIWHVLLLTWRHWQYSAFPVSLLHLWGMLTRWQWDGSLHFLLFCLVSSIPRVPKPSHPEYFICNIHNCSIANGQISILRDYFKIPTVLSAISFPVCLK